MNSVAFKGFNAGAQVYHAARPRYPLTAVEHLFSHQPATLATNPQSILEIGSGTGIFTEYIQRHFPSATITCLEPAKGMSDVASSVLPQTPPFTVLTATADAIPLPTDSVDRIYIAQAFHWFATVQALHEMHRVLKPGGVLGLVWNMEDKERAPWVRQIRALYEMKEQGTPQYRLGLWKRVFEEDEVRTMFDLPLQSAHFEHVVADKEAIWNRVLSKSYVSALSSGQQEDLRAKVMAVLEASDVEIEYDAEGHLLYPYKTDVFVTFKK
ncbi:S-adenosyl-L-methionine-dependent methyltransferase [Chytriomyces sp. MP71]|nr:S-adenosyl-L-methionine-dependent methyltransferase [Chytriomyces sp. MP71]